MLEFDRFVAAQGSVNMDHLDKSKTVKSSPGGQDFVGYQKKQLKLVPAVRKSDPVSAGALAPGKKTVTSVTQSATPMPTGTLRVIVGAGNTTAQNKTVVRKAAAPATTGGQNPLLKNTANAKGNQTPSNAAVGSGVPTSSQGSTVVNGANKANPLASSQASTVVNGASEANPPASSQTSPVVNGTGKANPQAGQGNR
uniref:Uncharacterized protein n=1 Tax=Arundo donax TaxID=35708 RepID=A0A0A9DDJ6_ARUDO